MDVTLDANLYLADPRMEGVGFRSLLDYLRKTQSNLVVPQVVLDEVLARYSDRLLAQAQKANSYVAALKSLVLSTKIRNVPRIDIARESRALKSKLTKPYKSLSSVVLKDFRGVSIEEVVRRGIERIPPANAKGEELRDVITWLMILGYASKSKRELAFITADNHFRRDNTLHPYLAKELQDGKLKLHLYGTIDEFIKAHAPAPHELVAEDAFALIGKQLALDRFELGARFHFSRYWRSATAVEVVSREVGFTRGALYDVGAESQYGEMAFSGELRIRVTTWEGGGTFTTAAPTVANTFADASFSVAKSLGDASSPFENSSSSALSLNNLVSDSAVFGDAFDDAYSGSWNLYRNSLRHKGMTLGPFPAPTNDKITAPLTMQPNTIYTLKPFGITTAEFNLSGKLVLSMRLVSGKVTHLETESFDPIDVSRVQDSG